MSPVDTPPARRGPRAATPPLLSRTVVNGLALLAALYTLLPLTWLLLAAGTSREALFASELFGWENLAVAENLTTLFSTDGGVFGRWYLNSLLYAGVGAALASLISVACGYAFDKYRFRHKEKLFGLVLAGVMVPQTVLALPLYLIASQIGAVNTVWAVLIPVLFNPFGVYLARIFARGYVPVEVTEAARLDGLGEVRIFTRVALRMLGPGFVTVFLFQLTAIWNNFFLPMVMLSDQDLFPLSLGLYIWNSQIASSPEYYPAVVGGALLALLPLVAAFLLLQRYWRSGLTSGAVK